MFWLNIILNLIIIIMLIIVRCQVAARTIANALRDICKKILIERSLAQVKTFSKRLIGTIERLSIQKRIGVTKKIV